MADSFKADAYIVKGSHPAHQHENPGRQRAYLDLGYVIAWVVPTTRSFRTGIAFTRNTVPVAVELVRVTRISPQHRLCVSLTLEVRAVVAVALPDVLRRIKPATRSWC